MRMHFPTYRYRAFRADSPLMFNKDGSRKNWHIRNEGSVCGGNCQAVRWEPFSPRMRISSQSSTKRAGRVASREDMDT